MPQARWGETRSGTPAPWRRPVAGRSCVGMVINGDARHSTTYALASRRRRQAPLGGQVGRHFPSRERMPAPLIPEPETCPWCVRSRPRTGERAAAWARRRNSVDNCASPHPHVEIGFFAAAALSFDPSPPPMVVDPERFYRPGESLCRSLCLNPCRVYLCLDPCRSLCRSFSRSGSTKIGTKTATWGIDKDKDKDGDKDGRMREALPSERPALRGHLTLYALCLNQAQAGLISVPPPNLWV